MSTTAAVDSTIFRGLRLSGTVAGARLAGGVGAVVAVERSSERRASVPAADGSLFPLGWGFPASGLGRSGDSVLYVSSISGQA